MNGERMPKTSGKKEADQLQVCPVCGNVNKVQSKFCDSCGSPLESVAEGGSSGDAQVPNIALGYATSIKGGKNSKDSFVFLDITSCFESEKHRKTLCAIIKGLEKVVDGKKVVMDLVTDICASSAKGSSYEARLSGFQKSLYQKISQAIISGEVKKEEETGILISILNSRKLISACVGSPCIYVLNNGEFKKTIKGSNTGFSIQSETIEDNEHVLMSCTDLTNVVGKKEMLDIIMKSENAQAASEGLLRKALQKRQSSSFSIAMAQVVGQS
jgi:hypothetical protein